MTASDLPPPEIVAQSPRRIAALVRDFTLATRDAIPALWHDYFAADRDVPGAKPDAIYGVSFSADGAGAFRYGVGREVPKDTTDLPEGLCFVHLADGPHAVFRRFGPLAGIPATFDAIFSGGLAAAGLKQAPGAVFERYPDDSRNGSDGMAYEIWVPVEV